ncbi:MAG: response regulator [Christensenellales bacterium]
MLRMLLADDDPVFLSKLERLLTQYAAQQQRKVWIDAYPRDDLSGFVLQSYDIAFLDIDFGDRRGAGIDLARRLRQKEMTQSSFLLPTMWNIPEGMNCARSVSSENRIDMKLEAYFRRRQSSLPPKRNPPHSDRRRDAQPDSRRVLYPNRTSTRFVFICFPAAPVRTALRQFAGFEESSSRWVSCGQKSFLVNMRHIRKLPVRRGCAGKRKRFRSAKRTTGRSSRHTSCGKAQT